ncbi:MAG: YitT family protein, partial [Clostridia bacterium]|nr:YitT family protein [Clostridia bacterium]
MDRQTKLREWLLLTMGAVLTGAGIYFFKFPNHFSTGGVTGVSVILTHYFPAISAGDFVFVINMVLLLIGFLVFGRSFGVRTAYVSMLMSAVISLLERTVPMTAPMTSEPFMELLFAVGLPA